MRVIAGRLKGRQIASFVKVKSTRPTKTKVREAVFSILGSGRFLVDDKPIYADESILEIFCGTASLSIEALSRGAKDITLIDKDPKILNATEATLTAFGERANANFIRADSTNLPKAFKKFKVIFVDPPYRQDLTLKAFNSLLTNNWLADGAILIVETGKYEKLELPNPLELIEERVYGISKISFIRFAGGDHGETNTNISS